MILFSKFIFIIMYSFEKFPDNPSTNLRLTPRSQEALLRSGFRLEDLTKKSAEEINHKYGDSPK